MGTHWVGIGFFLSSRVTCLALGLGWGRMLSLLFSFAFLGSTWQKKTFGVLASPLFLPLPSPLTQAGSGHESSKTSVWCHISYDTICKRDPVLGSHTDYSYWGSLVSWRMKSPCPPGTPSLMRGGVGRYSIVPALELLPSWCGHTHTRGHPVQSGGLRRHKQASSKVEEIQPQSRHLLCTKHLTYVSCTWSYPRGAVSKLCYHQRGQPKNNNFKITRFVDLKCLNPNKRAS